jgi:hypothetical protein
MFLIIGFAFFGWPVWPVEPVNPLKKKKSLILSLYRQTG